MGAHEKDSLGLSHLSLEHSAWSEEGLRSPSPDRHERVNNPSVPATPSPCPSSSSEVPPPYVHVHSSPSYQRERPAGPRGERKDDRNLADGEGKRKSVGGALGRRELGDDGEREESGSESGNGMKNEKVDGQSIQKLESRFAQDEGEKRGKDSDVGTTMPFISRRTAAKGTHINVDDNGCVVMPWPKVLDADYRCIQSCGSGSFGEVYKASHRSTGQIVAVKVMESDKWALHEASLLRELSHECICKLHEYIVSEEEGVACLVMEYASGGDLLERIVNTGPLTETAAACIAKSLLHALDHMHSKGLIHRDLKPENVLFTNENDDKLVLADFGVGKRLITNDDSIEEEREAPWGRSVRTHSRHIGTVGYSAPEVNSDEGHSFKADVWSFGAMIYVLLCGYHPFDMGDDPDDVIQERVRSGVVLPMTGSTWKYISEEARDFVRRCLIVNVEERASVRDCLQHAWIKRDMMDVGPVVELSEAFSRLKVYHSSRRESRSLAARESASRQKRKRESSILSDDSRSGSSTPVPSFRTKKVNIVSTPLPTTMEQGSFTETYYNSSTKSESTHCDDDSVNKRNESQDSDTLDTKSSEKRVNRRIESQDSDFQDTQSSEKRENRRIESQDSDVQDAQSSEKRENRRIESQDSDVQDAQSSEKRVNRRIESQDSDVQDAQSSEKRVNRRIESQDSDVQDAQSSEKRVNRRIESQDSDTQDTKSSDKRDTEKRDRDAPNYSSEMQERKRHVASSVDAQSSEQRDTDRDARDYSSEVQDRKRHVASRNEQWIEDGVFLSSGGKRERSGLEQANRPAPACRTDELIEDFTLLSSSGKRERSGLEQVNRPAPACRTDELIEDFTLLSSSGKRERSGLEQANRPAPACRTDELIEDFTLLSSSGKRERSGLEQANRPAPTCRTARKVSSGAGGGDETDKTTKDVQGIGGGGARGEL